MVLNNVTPSYPTKKRCQEFTNPLGFFLDISFDIQVHTCHDYRPSLVKLCWCSTKGGWRQWTPTQRRAFVRRCRELNHYSPALITAVQFLFL